ncbi:TIGR03087 family PEP-CTERM/XrtA system glycosyltransferase [Hyphococcus lacteus]|uniref:TIGR03087 family PEP-CTERM/XrtA system glycosyltransferase n=1 Tax=Hyphococcus lacteus TaxID=3143536 RepID=A0ABV3Z6E6_9PROT
MDEILLLTHRIPYPPNKGDKIRSWNLLKFLTTRFRVHLACFVDDPQDFAHTEFLSDFCESAHFVALNPFLSKLKSVPALFTSQPQSFRFYDHPKMRHEIKKLRARPLVAEIAFSSTMAPYLEPQIETRKRIVDFCDADSEKWIQYAEKATPPISWIYGREGHALAQAENTIANWTDHSFAVSNEEASLFNCRKEVERQVNWYTNGVDLDYFDPSQILPDKNKQCEVAFIGAMDYRANIEGVTQFTKNVWPHIRDQHPSARFHIVGSNPTNEITALQGTHGINVTGRVDDVRPWLTNASLIVAPLRVARGVQNKVLEAMAAGKSVVASPEAMTGIDAPAEAVFITDTDQMMAEKIISLLGNPTIVQQTGKIARAHAVSNFGWDSALKRLDDALAELNLFTSPPSK